MLFKDISYQELWWSLSSVEWNAMCNLGKSIMRNNSVKLF